MFVGKVSVSSIILSHVITKPSIILFAYLPFSQVHVAGCQFNFSLHACCFVRFLNSHCIYRYSTFNLSYIFYYRIYIHICMTDVLLIFLIHLFLLSYQKHGGLNLVLLGTRTLLDKSLRVLQLPVQLSKLTAKR